MDGWGQGVRIKPLNEMRGPCFPYKTETGISCPDGFIIMLKNLDKILSATVIVQDMVKAKCETENMLK